MTPFQPGGGGPTKDMSIKLPDGGGGDMSLPDGGGSDAKMAIVDMAGFNCAGCPKVTIDTPAAGTEVQYDNLTVTATITSGNSVIDASSVVIIITPPGGSVQTATMTLTGTANVYSGTISIAAVPSGPATFTVSAADAMGRKGSATGTYVHDHGPVITFLQPAAATAHGSVNVEIMVDDTLHQVTDPTAVSAYIFKQGDVTLTQEMGAVPLRMQGTILFSTFNPPLAGTQIIHAKAVNPKGTIGTATKQFIVDNDGPVISFVNPVPGQFIGGVVEIKANITDISGVNESSVLAVFGNDPTHNSVPLVRVDSMSDVFHGFFDVRSLGTSYVLPELSVAASDLLGNSSQLSEEIIVDNTPPRMTMDSQLQMFLSQLNTATNMVECSQPFSPLGPFSSVTSPAIAAGHPPEAAYNGAVMWQAVGLRARIEDEGNSAPGLLATHLSGVNDTTVYLFAIHDDQSTPLAVDTDGDGVCDNVNPSLVPSPSAMGPGVALSIKMEPMTTGGNADFRQPSSTSTYPAPVPSNGCAGGYGDPAVSKAPSILCTQAGTAQTVVIPWFDKGIAGPIYTIPPVAAMTGECVGLQLDAENTLPNGPTCVVAVATDKAGNTMVSPVLHICIDKSGATSSASADMAGTPCAGWPLGVSGVPPTATPPAGYQSTCTGVWDKVNMKITAGTCKAGPTFVNGEVRDLDNFK